MKIAECTTRIESAGKGIITADMELAANKEGVSPEDIRDGIAKGTIVILGSNLRNPEHYCAVGQGLRAKVNANLGTSNEMADREYELKKLYAALLAGADTVMDLSTGGDIDAIRRDIIRRINIPIGTVPIYEAQIMSALKHSAGVNMTIEDIIEVIKMHADDGVDYVTLHCGLTRDGIEKARKRKMPIVSRGGSLIAGWILHNNQENPLYTHFGRILELAKKYDLTISLGDGLRPGCLADATDDAQIKELKTIAGLAKRAREFGVQVMIEGPGHIPLHEIQKNVELEKELCDGAPFYVLGPLPTDIAPGYDHFVGGIGGALAVMYGADYLCAVTPAEHLGLPTPEDIRQGVIATRIAAHIGDIAKGIPHARALDDRMADARASLQWGAMRSIATDPTVFDNYRLKDGKPCTMCGNLCALKVVEEYFKQ